MSMRGEAINIVELDTHVLDRIHTSRIGSGRRDRESKSPQDVSHLEDTVSFSLGPLAVNEPARMIFPFCRSLT